VPGEAERCEEVRRVVTQVDWPCEVKTLFREQNLGCRQAVSEAVNWFFEHETEGIILEDDCLPAPDFFRFCALALAHWRDDERVMHIGGHVLLPRTDTGALFFSHLVPIWGWATWRRAWAHYDDDMRALSGLTALPLPDWYGRQAGNVARAIQRIHTRRVNAWGARWVLSVMSRQGLSVLPAVNLISNIGFGADATHTTADSHVANLPTGRLPATLQWPATYEADAQYDEAYLAVMNRKTHLFQRILQRLSNMLTVD
jgi:hypothetical protein